MQYRQCIITNTHHTYMYIYTNSMQYSVLLLVYVHHCRLYNVYKVSTQYRLLETYLINRGLVIRVKPRGVRNNKGWSRSYRFWEKCRVESLWSTAHTKPQKSKRAREIQKSLFRQLRTPRVKRLHTYRTGHLGTIHLVLLSSLWRFKCNVKTCMKFYI